MKRQIFLAAAIILFIGNNLPANVTIELPLDCAGTYTLGASSWVINFDLGVTFTGISRVYIEWSGEIMGGTGDYFGNPDGPFPRDVGIGVAIGIHPNWRHNDIFGGASTYPNPEPFNTTTDIINGLPSWSFLLDGKERLWLQYQRLGSLDIWYVEQGYVKLNNATLVVEGHVIPEPASFMLVTIGLISVRSIRKKLKLIV